jgi:hypothetical protein
METNGTAGDSGQSVSLPPPGALVKARVHLGVTRLFKGYLSDLEAFIDEHDTAMARLRDALPEQYKTYVNLADYITDEKVERIRKRILTNGNDVIRDIGTTVDSLRL